VIEGTITSILSTETPVGAVGKDRSNLLTGILGTIRDSVGLFTASTLGAAGVS
jgi:hypothetical protein